MKISEFSIRRGVTTGMLYALLILLGVVAIPKIPLEFMPKMDMPFIEIHVPYEDASPVEVCERIAEPIEEAVATLPGIKKMRTRCRQGYAYIGIELASGVKMDYMVLDIQERVEAIKKDLPTDVRNIFIAKFDTEQFPVVMGAVTFPRDRPENNELLDRYIVQPLKTVDGVASVTIEGLEERRVLVEIDQNKLTAYGVSVLQLFDAITAGNVTISAGTVDYAGKKHNLRIVGEFKDLREIRDLPVTATVKVGDIADVRLEHEKPFFIGRLNGQRAYILMVIKESGANTVKTCREIRREMDTLLSHPRLAGVNFRIWFDQSREITSSIDILAQSGLEGAALAFIVLWIFLKNIRSTLVISLSIPVSILCTIASMYFMGLSFNIITMSALIVAVGMLVDNSIVVLEAIDLEHRKGLSPFMAALHGSKEVGLAISVSTTTTVIVFLPLVFTGDSAASVLMKQLGLVLSMAITSSLVVSLTLIPLFASRILTPVHQGLPKWYERMSAGFLSLLRSALRNRFIALFSVGSVFILCLLILMWPFPFSKVLGKWGYTGKPLIEKEAIPASLMKVVRISVKFDQKPELAEIDAKMHELEELFMAKKEEWDIDTVAAIVSPMFTRIMLVLPDDRSTKYSAFELQDIATKYLAEKIHWAGVTFDTSGEGMHGPPGMGAGTSIKVRGPDPNQVYDFAELIRDHLEGMSGLKEIKPLEAEGGNELHIMVDRDLARQYGFNTDQAGMAVSYAIRGVPVGQLLSTETPVDIYLQLQEADRKTVAQLESMNIQNLRGEYIPLKNIAGFKMVPIPEQVRRDDRLITVRIPIVPEGKDLGEVAARISLRLKDLQLPMGYSWVMGEEFEERNEDLKTLGEAILLAMALVFLVMTAQFESFFLPFVIMFTLPFALIGVVLALLISHATFNVLSGAGCLLLVGIVVNNAIVLVDHVHNLRKRGLGENESLIQASSDRLRPIMMTALTTIVGLFPMAIGLNDTGRMMYSPLAIAVLGGLMVCTFLTPFVIPLIYSLSDDLMRWLRRIWAALSEV
ncbi:MAG TPA: efflux RND transporter permease subunit [bacterium]|nr:efflux RND transporter permease subunit [bacterium]